MPTFIDERGSTGAFTSGDTHFQLAAVWLPDLAAVEAFRARVFALRAELALPVDYEFKFSRTGIHPERRIGFFQAALEFPFRFAFASLDKRRPENAGLGHGGIHAAAVTELAATIRPLYLEQLFLSGGKRLNEPVIVDDNEDAEFLSVVKDKFRGLGKLLVPPVHLIGKVRFRGSGPDELIQLADMVVGALGANEDGNRQWYNRIANRDLGTKIPLVI